MKSPSNSKFIIDNNIEEKSMSFIQRLSRIPCGTISIYANRIYNRNKFRQQSFRSFQTSSQSPAIFDYLKFNYFNTSSTASSSSSFEQDSNSSTEDSNVDSSATPQKTSNYPPPLKIKWFYATDVPHSQPALFEYVKTEEPKEFLPFSDEDSDRLESQWQNIQHGKESLMPGFSPYEIPVLEDRLFVCDLDKLLLKPIYWEGSNYEIRRGVWFDKDNMPLKHELSDALEQLYLEIAPFSKDFDIIDDKMTLTKKFTEKSAVFTKENSVYLIDNNGSFTSFQVKYLTNSIIPPLLPVEKYSRGYKTDVSKEKVNQSQVSKSSLDHPKLETELREDYLNKPDGFKNNREIDHLVICIHGIGQVLGTKYESINFIHTVNQLRQTMKKVFKSNQSLQDLAYPDDIDNPDKRMKNLENCKVQVLPIIWRHHVNLNSKKKIIDDVSLSDITIDGIRPVRDMVGDIVLDVLLYYEPYYMNQILDQVVSQVNEVYDKYLEKNPDFHGKVSIVGHSLGSAISFDILCRQPNSLKDADPKKNLKVDVENFFAIGSPIGVFSLLKNCKISPRDGFEDFDSDTLKVKSPKVKNYYNVFHPCDPVAYRVEPLVCKEFSHYLPALIPFASNNIDAQIQNLTEMGDQLTTKMMENINVAIQTITPQIASSGEKMKNNTKTSFDKEEHSSHVSHENLEIMTKLNYSGRIDYSLPLGIFDISLVSMINSHVTYFEEPNISGFLLRELLLKKKSVENKEVTLLENETGGEEEEGKRYDGYIQK